MGKLSLSDIIEDAATIEVPIGENTLELTYKPSEFTPEQEQRFVAKQKGEVKSDALVQWVVDLVTEWQLWDGDRRIPVTTEELSKLPLSFIGDVIMGIAEDVAGKVEARAAALGNRT